MTLTREIVSCVYYRTDITGAPQKGWQAVITIHTTGGDDEWWAAEETLEYGSLTRCQTAARTIILCLLDEGAVLAADVGADIRRLLEAA